MANYKRVVELQFPEADAADGGEEVAQLVALRAVEELDYVISVITDPVDAGDEDVEVSALSGWESSKMVLALEDGLYAGDDGVDLSVEDKDLVLAILVKADVQA